MLVHNYTLSDRLTSGNTKAPPVSTAVHIEQSILTQLTVKNWDW